MKDGQLRSFEASFRTHSSTCRMTCNCGVVYFDEVNSGYSWEPGELEALQAGGGKPAGGSIGGITFEGLVFADVCHCWRERAAKIVSFIEAHRYALADFLRAEKQRRILEAEAAPVAEG